MIATYLQNAQEIATDERFSEMLKFFFIAVVIVVPGSVLLWRRMARNQAATDAAKAAESAPSVPEPEPLRPDEVASIVGAIDEAARSLPAGESITISVPDALFLDGSPAAPAIAEALIGDAISRNHLTAVWGEAPTGRTVSVSR